MLVKMFVFLMVYHRLPHSWVSPRNPLQLPNPLLWTYMLWSRHCFWWCLRHEDAIEWKHFPRYWPFVRGIHLSPVYSPHKGQCRGALMFFLICAINKRFIKHSWSWWFETPSRPLKRHFNGAINICTERGWSSQARSPPQPDFPSWLTLQCFVSGPLVNGSRKSATKVILSQLFMFQCFDNKDLCTAFLLLCLRDPTMREHVIVTPNLSSHSAHAPITKAGASNLIVSIHFSVKYLTKIPPPQAISG